MAAKYAIYWRKRGSNRRWRTRSRDNHFAEYPANTLRAYLSVYPSREFAVAGPLTMTTLQAEYVAYYFPDEMIKRKEQR